MKKIKDRLVLGAVAGVAGNLAKLAVETVAERRGIAENTSPKMATGVFVRRNRINSASGRIVGLMADNVFAAALGSGLVYVLSITGKDNAILKNVAAGQATWGGLYGIMSSIGVTSVRKAKPESAIATFVTHTVFGVVTGAVAVALGDPGLFNGEIPISA